MSLEGKVHKCQKEFTSFWKVVRMQLNVMPEHSVALGQICIALLVNEGTKSSTDGCKRNVILYACEGTN